MSQYFGIIGAIMVTAAALLIGIAYSAYLSRRLSEYSAYLAFLELMRREVSCSLCTACELGERSSDSLLEELGFLNALREGERLSSAFSAASPASLMNSSDRELLERYFECFGLSSLEAEIRSLDSCISSFSSREREERERLQQRKKLALALLMLFAAAVTLLLI